MAAAYAAQSPTAAMARTSIPRRLPGPRDVQIDVLYCGVCHSDLHQVRNEWESMPTVYPCVPGHEIVGRVAHAGDEVRKFEVGDIVAVGCMVDSCRTCAACQEGLEQYCERVPTFTYNSEDEHLGGVTYGGYSTSIVVDEAFVLSVPRRGDLAGVAPLLCAGITTYSPLRHWQVGEGHKVGIVGLGGLGHMGVKFASAFGAHVVVFTRSKAKAAEALRLGADDVVISTDSVAMRAHARSFHFILDTVSAKHDLDPYLELLRRDGTLTLVGAPSGALSVSPFELLLGRRRLAGSGIGGIAETQEMLDFCADHRITADVEIIDIQRIEEAFERLLAGDVKYRFVIDMASLRGAST
ncbi:MAG TPA: NAD(P)-dependent alcohol dehydrogenase [Gammaproteobacteria bacterium]